MPVSLLTPTRRKFLSSLGATFVSMPLARALSADVDEDLIAILNDPHIGEKQAADSPIPQHLKTTVDWLIALPKRPAAVLINGALALRDGQPGDYRHFAQLIEPLRAAGL